MKKRECHTPTGILESSVDHLSGLGVPLWPLPRTSTKFQAIPRDLQRFIWVSCLVLLLSLPLSPDIFSVFYFGRWKLNRKRV